MESQKIGPSFDAGRQSARPVIDPASQNLRGEPTPAEKGIHVFRNLGVCQPTFLGEEEARDLIKVLTAALDWLDSQEE